MKKFFCLLVLILLLPVVSACEDSTIKELKKGVEDLNKECPMNLGLMGDMISVKYMDDTKTVEIYVVVNDEYVNVEVLKNNKDMMLLSMNLMSNENRDSRKFLELSSDAGVSLKYTFKSKDTSKSVDIMLTPEEIKKILSEPVDEDAAYELQLKTMIENENSMYPQDLGNGLTMQSVKDTGDDVLYLCYMDEDYFDLSMVDDETKEAMKDGIVEMLDDVTVKAQLKTFVKNGRGLIYRYQGNRSGKTIDIVFNVEELKQHL